MHNYAERSLWIAYSVYNRVSRGFLCFALRKRVSGGRNAAFKLEEKMMKEVRTYQIVPIGKCPTMEDIFEAREFAKENHCIVNLQWSVKYNGLYNTLVDEDSDIEAVYNGLPKVYGV